MKKILIAGLIFIFIMLIGYMFLYKRDRIEQKDEGIARSTIIRHVAAEGKVEVKPGFEVEVSSELDGKIVDFPVEEGDFVKKGDLLAKLENRDIYARLKEAKAEYDLAASRLKEVEAGAKEEEINKAEAVLERTMADMVLAAKELERYEQLFKEGLVKKSDMDEKERMFKVTEAKVKEADEEKRLVEKGPRQETLKVYEDAVKRSCASVEYFERLLEKTFISAPISGKVIRKYLQKGEVISKEMLMPVVAIADLKKIWINAEVDETDIGRVRIGNPVEVTSDAYPAVVFKGEVQEISDYVGVRKIRPNNPAKNLDMKVIEVKIELKDRDAFKPGMTVDVKIMPDE